MSLYNISNFIQTCQWPFNWQLHLGRMTDVTVYRKPTHTDRNVDLQSHYSPHIKRGLVSCLYNIAQSVTNTQDKPRKEETTSPMSWGRITNWRPSSTPQSSYPANSWWIPIRHHSRREAGHCWWCFPTRQESVLTSDGSAGSNACSWSSSWDGHSVWCCPRWRTPAMEK